MANQEGNLVAHFVGNFLSAVDVDQSLSPSAALTHATEELRAWHEKTSPGKPMAAVVLRHCMPAKDPEVVDGKIPLRRQYM